MKSPFLMRRACCIAAMMVILSGLLVIGGCGTVGESSDEVRVRHDRVINNNLGRIQDDVDAVFLLDRPGRMSPQPVR
ncbi:MAG: hypothetical protein GX455_00475 [Phycisphaerae bacterium]|nr:hypothetical protein [Phycisphaerae bacterium]